MNCDNCGENVVVQGHKELHYVHSSTDSVYCTDRVASVDGHKSPVSEPILIVEDAIRQQRLFLSPSRTGNMVIHALLKAGYTIEKK